MIFKIKNLILWPKNEDNDLVNIEFETDKVNVITGGSSRGKSAIISIIDYCLGSSDCKIPTNVIRNKVAWFGILVELKNNNKILLARKEPGVEKVSNEMFLRESSQIEVPNKIQPNLNSSQVRARLDRLTGLTKLDFNEDDEKSAFKSRPAFRDLVSFNFQPQHIVANKSTLFNKTDLFQYREKLRTIFPYVLGAVTDSYLKDRELLKELTKEVNSLQNELSKRQRAVSKWISELRSNYIKAKEFGLIDGPFPDENWSSQVYIDYLRRIEVDFDGDIPRIQEGISSEVVEKVNELEKREVELSHILNNKKYRFELIRKLEESNRDYRNELLEQRDRLKSVDWFNKHLSNDVACPFCGSENESSKESIKLLEQANSDILRRGNLINDNYITLSNETQGLRKEIRSIESQINDIRKELEVLRTSDEKSEKRFQNVYSIYRFAGSLETGLKNYELFTENSDLLIRIEELTSLINDLEAKLSKVNVQVRLDRARKLISELIKEYAKLFEAEYYQDAIKFDENNLTVTFITNDGRENALYEIGGGENYMAYHISTLFAIHEFLIAKRKEENPVPSFVVFDQPTQVYFPDRPEGEVDENMEEEEDIEKVKTIFKSFSQAIKRNPDLQVIVLDHVGSYAWENLDNVHTLRRWRGKSNESYLIPLDWS